LPGQLLATIPGDGGTLAENGAIYFTGRNLAFDEVSFTSDLGLPYEPITIATLDPRADEDGATLVVVLEPTPMPGEQLTVAGNFCSDRSEACDYTLKLTIGDEDPEILLPPTDVPPKDDWTETELVSDASCGDPMAEGCSITGHGPTGLAALAGLLVVGLGLRRRRNA